ncbi:hypothetical protein PENTCL1PPCAC_7764, partial [Pristionchus entomophagus]
VIAVALLAHDLLVRFFSGARGLKGPQKELDGRVMGRSSLVLLTGGHRREGRDLIVGQLLLPLNCLVVTSIIGGNSAANDEEGNGLGGQSTLRSCLKMSVTSTFPRQCSGLQMKEGSVRSTCIFPHCLPCAWITMRMGLLRF